MHIDDVAADDNGLDLRYLKLSQSYIIFWTSVLCLLGFSDTDV